MKKIFLFLLLILTVSIGYGSSAYHGKTSDSTKAKSVATAGNIVTLSK